MTALPGFNPKVDRYNWRRAARLFKSLWPNPKISRAFASALATSIRVANEAGDASWEITMFADRVRLNVGPVLVLDLSSTKAYFYVSAPLELPPGHNYRVREVPFRAVRGPVLVCKVPAPSLPSLPPAVRQAHNAFIRTAAARRAVSPWKDAYSPAIVEYLKRETGESLPHPSYYKGSKEEPDAEGHITATLERAGFQSDPDIREAVERLAMKAARIYLAEAGYSNIKDNSESKPYDFTCEHNGHTWFVEVKGTQTIGDAIALTNNEKTHAEENLTNSILFVLHSVKVEMGKKPKASGGKRRILRPWDVSQGILKPIAWIYNLPE